MNDSESSANENESTRDNAQNELAQESSHDESTMPATGGSGNTRKAILAVILLLVVLAFAYDQFIAKPAYQQAADRMNGMQTMVEVDGEHRRRGDINGDGKITPNEVREYLGKEPSSATDLESNRYYETFSWARPIPGYAYRLYAVYRQNEQKEDVLFQVTDGPPEEHVLDPVEPSSDSPELAVGGGGTPPDNSGSEDKKQDQDKQDQEAEKKEDGKSKSDGDDQSDAKKDDQSDPKKGDQSKSDGDDQSESGESNGRS